MMPTLSDYDDDNAAGPVMKRAKPPFRADHVGSLLRPAALKAAREKRAKGEIDAAALKAVEDREIERVIKKQEEVGLQSITDGEFRRSWWHLDFLWGLDGAEKYIMEQGISFTGLRTRAEAGCRYLQLDEVFIAMLCDPNYRETQLKHGDDPARLANLYADLINA